LGLEEKLREIREISGKGYVGNWRVKMIHICPKCGETKGWIGPPAFTCLNCGAHIPPEEWLRLPCKAAWAYLGK